MERNVKIKNVGRCNFHLSLDFSRTGKHIDMKPNTEVLVTEDEYNYLINQFPKMFSRGFLKLVSDNKELEIIKSDNIFTDDEINQLLNEGLKNFKAKIGKITETRLLKELLNKAIEENKNDKYINVITNRIDEVADSLVL